MGYQRCINIYIIIYIKSISSSLQTIPGDILDGKILELKELRKEMEIHKNNPYKLVLINLIYI